eukprot:PhM_4_TR16080/c0_g1_i1/m.38359
MATRTHKPSSAPSDGDGAWAVRRTFVPTDSSPSPTKSTAGIYKNLIENTAALESFVYTSSTSDSFDVNGGSNNNNNNNSNKNYHHFDEDSDDGGNDGGDVCLPGVVASPGPSASDLRKIKKTVGGSGTYFLGISNRNGPATNNSTNNNNNNNSRVHALQAANLAW